MSFTTTVAATRNTGSSKTSLTVTAPSGTGGIIVGFFAASTVSSVTVNATTTVTTLYPPESFSQVFWWPDDGQGSWTFTFASANGPSAILLRVVGEDSSSPIAASSYLFTPSSGYTQPYQTPTTPVSPPDPNSLLVCGWASSQVFTVPADLTAAGNFGSGGWVTLAVGYKTPSGSPTTAEAAPIAGSANADGYQVAIAPAATAATPGAPTGVTAVAGDTDAIVSWTAPASDGGSAITSYTVTATPGGLTQSTANGSTTSLTFTGLTNGTAYTFTVHATNSVGNSAESAASNSVTPTASSFTGTGAVAAPAVTAAGTGTFVPPSFNGSGTVSAAAASVSGSGTFTTESFIGAGSVSASVPVVAGSGSFTVAAIIGTGTLTAPTAVVSGSGVFYPTAGSGGRATVTSTSGNRVRIEFSGGNRVRVEKVSA